MSREDDIVDRLDELIELTKRLLVIFELAEKVAQKELVEHLETEHSDIPREKMS